MQKQKLVFAHANGYPPLAYKELLDQLEKEFEIHLYRFPAMKEEFTDKHKSQTWHDFAIDFAKYIKENNLTGSIVAGHSMGGIVALAAASKDKDLLRKLILIDPTLLAPHLVWASRFLPEFFQRKYNPVVVGAFRRKDFWKTKEEAYLSFRKKNVFSRMSDNSLKQYVEAALVDKDGGQTLAFSKRWEEHCYRSVINPWPHLKRCEIPTLGIRGQESTVVDLNTAEKWKRYQPHLKLAEVPNSGHLVPLEQPNLVAQSILNFLK